MTSHFKEISFLISKSQDLIGFYSHQHFNREFLAILIGKFLAICKLQVVSRASSSSWWLHNPFKTCCHNGSGKLISSFQLKAVLLKLNILVTLSTYFLVTFLVKLFFELVKIPSCQNNHKTCFQVQSTRLFKPCFKRPVFLILKDFKTSFKVKVKVNSISFHKSSSLCHMLAQIPK